ncbi:MAG: UTP--glucose-1-phosphate uridylyltransferase GalU [Gammaproteobacteria bacterium]|nr:UTP--glucose-1-phosphate uridylyltransferase GalU [Gammaproteobacteria bacterium]
MAIKTAVFPVAGMGTRFLPATKANPKEMLPIVDKPLIQYAVEEAVAAGITQLVFVTSWSKGSIEDHFDRSYELEDRLRLAGKNELLDSVRNILPKGVSVAYVRQAEPLGLGHAVLCAQPIVGDQPFAVLLADDFIHDSKGGCLKDMVDLYAETGLGSVAVEDVPREQTDRYGIVSLHEGQRQGQDVISAIVEKPNPAIAPSTLAVVGRYLLPGKVFEILEHTGRGKGGEIQLTDAIAELLSEDSLIAHRFKGTRYDCGSKFGYLQATVALGMEHAEVGPRFRAYMEDLAKSLMG